MFMRSPATGFNGPARNIAICLLHPLKPLAKYATTDRWPSGRRRTPGKCVGGEPSPGFESLSIRHLHLPKQMMGPHGALFSFCFKGV